MRCLTNMTNQSKRPPAPPKSSSYSTGFGSGYFFLASFLTYSFFDSYFFATGAEEVDAVEIDTLFKPLEIN
jgi:hypothetical protein